ncbi:NAC domain-containing protein [Radiomyces spectabilis]|uniref:NAC domain-containing protein n=1 Tax=Radiomyces spectabilis TaxID=64574 RepID=UPI0022203CBF|nr:NAC domain-containing protein [Radiomyces spectabilis]KAI8365326.1 NAC domain-containing protein [Radiomyces spectabilis]
MLSGLVHFPSFPLSLSVVGIGVYPRRFYSQNEPDLKMNAEKLAKLQSQVRIGGKGTPRRKTKKVTKASGNTDDRKLQAALQKTNVQPIPGIEEVNMFKDDGKVIHFAAPRVQAAVNANTFAIHGRSSEKDLTELVPGILNQLGPDSLESLRKLAEAYQSAQGGAAGEDDDEIPDLVESFDKAEVEDKKEDAKEEAKEATA